MAVRSAKSYNGNTVPGFPVGGPCRIVTVGPDWTALLASQDADLPEPDLLLVRVPEGSKRVIMLATKDVVDGTTATIDQSNVSWILDPGVWELCVDRDRETGPRVYLAIDPADGSDDAATAAVRVMEAASE